VPDEVAGLVVPPESPGALATAITRFFAEEMGDALRAGASRQKEKHAPARLGEAIERLLASST